MQPIEVFKAKDLVAEIHYDPDPESPRTWDNLGTLALSSRFAGIADEVIDRDGLERIEREAAVCLRVWFYDHGGVGFSTDRSRYPFNCPWDSGLAGVIYVDRDRILREYGGKRLTHKLRQQAAKVLQGEVEILDEWATGQVYGYKIYRLETCNLGHQHRELIDSCWGFYGLDYVKQEAQEALEYYQKQAV
ncbi:MAG: hypothetical protein JRI66_11270 [Deltaproteobacteria bacterium]|nr:hypothetical protein [Deltaproteobacteria bacterium]